MNNAATKEKSAQPALTPDEAVELTKYLTLETFAYVIGRASQEYIHCSNMLNNIIETNRREYRRSVGKKHETPNTCPCCGHKLGVGEHIYCNDCSDEINA